MPFSAAVKQRFPTSFFILKGDLPAISQTWREFVTRAPCGRQAIPAGGGPPLSLVPLWFVREKAKLQLAWFLSAEGTSIRLVLGVPQRPTAKLLTCNTRLCLISPFCPDSGRCTAVYCWAY